MLIPSLVLVKNEGNVVLNHLYCLHGFELFVPYFQHSKQTLLGKSKLTQCRVWRTLL